MNMEVQAAFRALADPTRRQILMHLSEDEMTIGAVSERFDITRAAIKKHLNILEEGNMISVQVRGRERVNRFNPEGMKSAAQWVRYFDRFWDDKMSRLKKAVEQNEKNREQSK